MSITLLILTVVLLTVGVPIAVGLGMASTLTLMIYKPVPNLQLIPQLLSEATTSFLLIAVPLFILAGVLMEKGTIGRNLIEFATSIVGWMKGGLGACTIVSAMIFGGISGSSLADCATFGTIIVPRMEEDGYPKEYAATVVLFASCLDVIIPPSILIVLAAVATETSVAKALAAGVIPGIFLGIIQIIPNYIICKKNNYGTKIPFSIKNVIHKFMTCWTALIAPAIILGTIFSGIVTPTEGAAIAVLYVLIVDGIFFKKLSMKDLKDAFKSTASLTSAILFIATSSTIANWVIAYEGVPDKLAKLLLSAPGGKIGFMVAMIVLLMIIGATIDATPATLIFTPLFLPIAVKLGIDPTHFITFMIVGFAIGLTTPPYGVCLFSMSAICKVPMERLVIRGIPFYITVFAGFLAIAFIPEISTFLPNLFKL